MVKNSEKTLPNFPSEVEKKEKQQKKRHNIVLYTVRAERGRELSARKRREQKYGLFWAKVGEEN